MKTEKEFKEIAEQWLYDEQVSIASGEYEIDEDESMIDLMWASYQLAVLDRDGKL